MCYFLLHTIGSCFVLCWSLFDFVELTMLWSSLLSLSLLLLLLLCAVLVEVFFYFFLLSLYFIWFLF